MRILFLWLFLLISGCVSMTKAPDTYIRQPASMTNNLYRTEDNISLPLRQWLPSIQPKAVLIALHGFNDYSNFFDQPGKYFSELGIACFAYDQRGFGNAPKRGRWAGIASYRNDLLGFVGVLKERYPNVPVYVLGESMGAAVIIAALSKTEIHKIDGAILVAPAVWARDTMPWYQTSLLWTLAHTVPWMVLSGDGVKRQASDNIEMLKALGRDPLVIKKTRVEAIKGLTDLMDTAYSSAHLLQGNTLVLYGEKDEIIPKDPTYQFLQRFIKSPGQKKSVGIYPQGYHMLLRDLKASVVWEDIVNWINHSTKLPSGAEHRAVEVLKDLL